MLFHACVNKPVLLTNKPPMAFRELKGHIHAQKEFCTSENGIHARENHRAVIKSRGVNINGR